MIQEQRALTIAINNYQAPSDTILNYTIITHQESQTAINT